MSPQPLSPDSLPDNCRALLYALATAFAENDTKYHGALKQALALGEKQRYGSAYPVLYQLFEQLRGSAPQLSYLRSTELDGLDGLLLALAFYWLDAPLAREVGWCTKLQDHRAQLDQQGYAWLAAEFDALISAQFGVPRLLHHVHEDAGLKPFVTLLQRQEAWEHALNALTQLKLASAPAHPAAKKTTRLAWLVNPRGWSTQLEPREQKLSAKGQWSKGRPVALKRLMDEVDSLDFLCEQDRQAIRLIQAGHPYYSHIEYELPLGVALPKLVGHPALFWHDAPDVRVELEAGHASLRLEAQEGRLLLRLEPQGVVTEDTYYLHQQTPTQLQVYSINSELRQIAKIIGKGLRLNPLTAPLLTGLEAEVGEFTADKGWQAHLQKLQSLRDYQPKLPRTLQADLRAYQHEGFTWLARLAQWGVGACLADDMGLGKTVQILALLLQRAADGPQLVVAPTSVTLNWQAESRRFAPQLKLRLYHQDRNLADLAPGDVVITSYGLLQQDSAAFAACGWNSVVLDEAQAIKNAQTKRAQAVMDLQSNFRVVATGTPLENHLGELWSLFRFINPGLLGSQESFNERFAQPIERGDGAARRTLKALIQPFILRRLKSQVLDELPARTEITYKVPLSDEEAHLYEALRQQAVDSVADAPAGAGRSFKILTEITRLRRFCCHPSLVTAQTDLPGSKLQAFSALVDEILANGHKALVFSQYVDHLSLVRTVLDSKRIAYQYLDGSVPAKERERRVNAFQAGSGDIFLISLKAGGSGLNLTAADYVIHLDPWWNPAVEDQASDRAYRIGQQRPVTIYRLVAENSIEEQIVALHARKRDLADSLLEGGEMSAKLDADALLALLANEVN